RGRGRGGGDDLGHREPPRGRAVAVRDRRGGGGPRRTLNGDRLEGGRGRTDRGADLRRRAPPRVRGIARGGGAEAGGDPRVRRRDRGWRRGGRGRARAHG